MKQLPIIFLLLLIVLSTSASAILFFEDNFTDEVKPDWVEIVGPWQHNSTLDAYQIIYGGKAKTRVDMELSYALVETKIIEVSTLQNSYFDIMHRATPDLASGYSIAYVEVYSRLYDLALILFPWNSGSRGEGLDYITWTELGLSGIEDLEGKKIGIKVKGDVITGYLDGVQILNATDDTYPTGYVGIIANSGIEAFIFDNFKIQNPASINARDDYGEPAVIYNATNANQYGVWFIPLQNYTLYKVQKNPLHNPDDLGNASLYCLNTTTMVNASWSGDNATFPIPVNITKGYHYRVFDNPGASRAIKYGVTVYFPNVLGTYGYNNFTEACYGTTNCETKHGEGRPNGGAIILYLDNLTLPPPDLFPQWSNNITSGAPFYIGDTIYAWVFLSDDDELSHKIFSANFTEAWVNMSTTDISNATQNASSSWIQNRGGVVGWKWYFNDSANQWNVTDVFIANVLDRPPQWSNLSQSSDTSLQGVPVTVYSTWDNGLNLSHWQVQYFNTTHWENSSIYNFSYTATCAIDFNTSCNINLGLTNPRGIGNWSWFFRANDSANQWNTTDRMNFSVTADPYPQWSDLVMNATTFVNWNYNATDLPTIQFNITWDDNINLSFLKHSLWNGTHWKTNVTKRFNSSDVVCSGDYNTSCKYTYTTTFDIYYWETGNWAWKVFANDSLNHWNVSDMLNFTVTNDQNLARIIEWTVDPCFTSTYGRPSWQLYEFVNFTYRVNSTWVRTRVILYDGEGANQTITAWSTGYISPHWFTHSLNITNVTTNSTFVMQARDDYNGTIINVTDWYSVVVTGGVIEGECSTSMGYTITPAEPDVKESLIFGTISKYARFAGLSLSIFWIFMMAMGSITIWIYLHTQPFMAAASILGFNLAATIFGMAVGAISAGMLFLLVLFLVVTAIIMFKRQVS